MSAFRALLLSFVYCSPVVAAEFFTSGRIIGRGNTSVAQYAGAQGGRFNPATLAETNSTFQLRPLEFNGIVGENVVSTISDIQSHDFSSNDSNKVISFVRKFGDKFGERHYGRFELIPLATQIFRFEAMPFVINQSYIEINRPTIPEFDFDVDTLAGINLAYGYDFNGKFKVGGAVRPTYHHELEGALTFTDLIDLENLESEEISKAASGFGIGVDAGVLWTPTATLRLGAVVQNIGGMGYLSSDGSPSVLLQSTSIGGAYAYKMSRWDFNFLAAVKHLENPDGEHWIQLLNLGAEFGRQLFTRDLDIGLTAGLYDGNTSYGLFVDLWLARVELAKYTEEIGRQPGVKRDKRLTMTISSSMTL